MRSTDRDLDWRGEHLALRPATPADVPAIVALHRGLEPAPTPDASPVDWFRSGGPWMHEHFCERHIQAYLDLGWDCWVLERNGETIAGSVEVLYATEPEPFGRYAHPELLELSGDIADAEVEHWILDQCESRARARGFDRFWCRPFGSGGSWAVLADRGYEERWRVAWLTVRNVDRVEPPAFADRPLEGDYDREASHLFALDHRESAAYRWRYLWRPVRTPEISDFPTDVSFSGRSITLPGRPDANVLVTVWRWRDPESAWADLFVAPELVGDAEYVSDQIAIAAGQASSMGANVLNVVIPEPLPAAI